ncbi:MAG TPA: glycoside hydrolase family protein [Caulobacteraceae bacterium]|nr:glycoside hydrolase family protein [Caulobacteraceae bacterium]
MTTLYLDEDLAKDEGFRSHAYPDPLTGAEPWTCGYGCTGPDVTEDTVWTQAQAWARMQAKRAEAEAQLSAQLPWWKELNDARQDALVNMAYQLGIGHLLGFQHALTAMERADWATAASAMLASEWAKQTPSRAIRLAKQMHDGVRIPA